MIFLMTWTWLFFLVALVTATAGIIFLNFISAEYRILLQQVGAIWAYAWAPIGLITIILDSQTSKLSNTYADPEPVPDDITAKQWHVTGTVTQTDSSFMMDLRSLAMNGNLMSLPDTATEIPQQ